MEKASNEIRILLIRHGETEWNQTHRFQGRSDVHLNQKGRRQAHALALALKSENLTAIYSSPLTRAKETARIIGSFHPSAPLHIENGLIEMDIGDFDGMPASQWVEKYPDFLKAWRKDPSLVRMPGGETLSEVQSRVNETLERITRSYYSGRTLLMASHNFVILSLLCHAMKLPLSRFRELKQGTAALNILYKKDDTLRAEVVNSRSHLKDLEDS